MNPPGARPVHGLRQTVRSGQTLGFEPPRRRLAAGIGTPVPKAVAQTGTAQVMGPRSCSLRRAPQAPPIAPIDGFFVGRQGLEPWTYGLKVRSSTD